MSRSDDVCDGDAMAAYQSFLDQSDAALEHDDFDTFISRILLPQLIIQGSERLIVTSTDEIRHVFHATRHMLATRNIRRRTRLCTNARLTGDGTLIGHHTTWLVTTDNTIDESYRVESHLRQRDGVWCILASSFAGPSDALPGRMHQASLAAQRNTAAHLAHREDSHD
ncbi:hypothetical protein Jann_3317 [Jannaschia sp. CCS1]|nr:hypothetical protein Jann_3317 [Jannaschia sp. CCS1]